MDKQQARLFDGSQLGLDLGDSAAATPINAHAVRLQLNALIEQAQAECRALDWKMHDVVIVPVREFPETASARSGES